MTTTSVSQHQKLALPKKFRTDNGSVQGLRTVAAPHLRLASMLGLFFIALMGTQQATGQFEAAAAATVKTWKLGTGSSDWKVATNWVEGAVPAATDSVIFPATSTVQTISNFGGLSMYAITILGNYTFDVGKTAASFTVSGHINVAATYTLTLPKSTTLIFGSGARANIQGILSSENDFTVNPGNDVAVGPDGYIIAGLSTTKFTLSDGATLRIGSTAGIVPGTTNGGATTGNIRFKSLSYGQSATYVYNGVAAQSLGEAFPVSILSSGSLIIDNPVSVTVPNTTVRNIGGNLILLRGNFITNNKISLGLGQLTATTTLKRAAGVFTGTVQTGNWYNVEYNGSSKTTGDEFSGTGIRSLAVNLNAGDTLYLNSDKIIPQYLYLTSGKINTGTYTLIHTDMTDGSIFGAGPNTYVIGKFRRYISPGISEYSFPVGGTTYSPVKLSFSVSDGGQITISTTNADNTNISSSSLNRFRTVNRSWNLNIDAGLFNYTYDARFSWQAAEQDVDFNRSLALVAQYNSNEASWSYPVTDPFGTTDYSILASGLSSVGQFQVGQQCVAASINTHPVGGSICTNTETLNMSVVPAGHAPFTYSWQKDNQTIPAATSANYTASAAGSYKIVVQGQCGLPTTSNAAVVFLKAATAISSQPVGGAKCAGDTISVVGSGEGNLSYQWYKNNNSIPGATNAYYNVTDSLNANYKVDVTGSCGTVTSNSASVTMNLPTRVKVQPTNQTITYGDNVAFGLQAEGTSTLRYSWQVKSGNSWNNSVDGAVTESLTTPSLQLTTPVVASTGKKYQCVVTGLCGSATSNEVILTVNPATIRVTPDAKSRIYGEANSGFTASYSGYKNGETFANSGVQGSPLITTTARDTSSVGTYPLIAALGSLSAANYVFAYDPGTLTITKALLTVKADTLTRYYGDANPDYTVTYSGFKNGESYGGNVVSGVPEFTTAATTASGVGTYSLAVAQGTLSARNYDFTFVNAGIKVLKSLLRVTATNRTREYGLANPEFSISFNGSDYKNGESFGSIGLTGTPVYLTDADIFSPVGDYTIIPSKGTMSVPNYDFQFVNGKLSVTKATLTVRAVDTTRYYGFDNPVFRAAFSGFRNNEDFASSGIVGYPSLTVAADLSTPIGSTPIVAAVGNNFSSRNYQFQFQNGTMNIVKAVLTVKANRLDKFYGDPRPDLTYTITGFRAGESFGGSIASGVPVLQNTVDEFTIPGKYPIDISIGTLQAGNYDFSLVKDTLIVKKSPLTVKALPATREYGESNPAFSAEISGYKNGQDSASSGYTGMPGFTTIAEPSTPVKEGGYPILPTLGSLAAQNYSFAFDTASLTITRAPLKVYAVDTFRSYGYPNPAFRANYIGLKNSETFATSDLKGLPELLSAADTNAAQGPYPITAALGSLSSNNYDFIEFQGATMTVGKATLRLKADPLQKIYGDPNPTLTYKITGMRNGETFPSEWASGNPEISTTATQLTGVGKYLITVGMPDFSSTNYDLQLVPDTLTINKATLTFQMTSTSRIYGDQNPTFRSTVTGYKNSEDSARSGYRGLPGYSTVAIPTTGIGTYDVTPTLGTLTATNYNFSFVKGSLTITQAQLRVAPVDTFRIYGDANPVFRPKYTGFKNGEAYANSGLQGQPALTTTATNTSNAGRYRISAAAGGLTATNYSLVYDTAAMTINKALLTVTANDTVRTYVQANPVFTARYSGFKNSQTLGTSGVTGTPALTTTAIAAPSTSLSNVGQYPINIALGTLSSINYDFTFTGGRLTINPATLTVKADNLSKVYGAANPALTYTYTGFASGQTLASSDVRNLPAISTTAVPESPVTTYPILISQGALTSTNYSFLFTDGVLTINKAPLQVVADNKTREYGEPNPDFTYKISGFVLNQDSASSGFTGMPALTTTATATTAAGSNPSITVGVGSLLASNYSFTLVNGTINITKANLLVTTRDTSRVYGANNPAFASNYTGFKNNETLASSGVRGTPSYSTVAVPLSFVGTYDVTPALGSLTSTNYSFSYAPGVLTINKGILTIIADNKTREYGSPNPNLTISYTGLPNNATLASTGTTGSATISTMADMTSPVGAYDIVVDSGDLASPNYTFNVVYGKMNITKALLAVSADLKIKLYGEDNPSLSVSITGFKNNEDSASSGIIGNPILTTTATKTSPVGGNYTITVTAGTLSATNYSFTFKNSSMIIGKAVLKVIAENKSRTYGAANPAFTVVYDGFVLGQTYANSGVTGIPEYFTDAVTTSPVGTYGIGVSNGTLVANNYSFEFYAGTLNIDKAPLRVTADNKTRGYGSPDPVFTATYTGFVNGQTFNTSGIKGAPMLSTTADALSPLGTYPIIPDVGTMESSNYSFSFVNGSLSVGKANLVVRAENKSKVYGSGNPPLTYVVEGFVNNETLETSGVSGTATLSTTVTNASVVGNYPITPAVGSLTATNYAFTFTNGSLTVGKAPLTVIADNKTRAYGAANPTYTASYTGFVNGQTLANSGVTGTPAMSANTAGTTPIGDYPINISQGNLSSANYEFSYTPGILTIGKAMLTLTADNKTKAFGAALPAFSASYSGFANGENFTSAGVTGSPAYSTLATQYSDQGSYPIRPAVGTLSAPNYNFTMANGTLTIGAASCSSTGTLATVDSCYENLITVKFTPTSGTGPFTLIINDSVYRNVTSGATFATNAISRTAPETLLSDIVPDNQLAVADVEEFGAAATSPMEVGVKFRPNVAGQITGIRFYKLSTNTGTHTGSLWSSTGTLLASATFTNESASGWQQVTFSTPVTVTANTTYYASYYAPSGNVTFQANAFDSKRLTNPTGSLTAFSATDGGNGYFKLGAGFPNSVSPVNANYYVDVIFKNTNSVSRFALTGVISSTGCATNALPIQALTTKMTPLINVSFTKPVMECLESTNGSLTFAASSCNLPIQYSVDSGASYQTSATFTNLGVGTYKVRIRDSKNAIKDTVVVLDIERVKWVGNNTGFWDVAGSWSTGKVPTVTSHVMIPAGVKVTVRGNATAASVQLMGTGANVEVKAGFKLSLTGQCKDLPAQ